MFDYVGCVLIVPVSSDQAVSRFRSSIGEVQGGGVEFKLFTVDQLLSVEIFLMALLRRLRLRMGVRCMGHQASRASRCLQEVL